MWIITGIISMITVILALLLAMNRNDKKFYMSMVSITFLALTLLLEYKQIYGWVMKEDWSALMDVVPSMFGILCGYTIIVLLLNGFVLALKNK